jgi:Na+/proline symporter
MSNALKGMVAGLVATLVLCGLMVLNSATELMPQINIIRWLTALGSLSVPSAWMDHFIVGVIIWGLLFAVYDGAASRPAPWLKGIIFGVFTWLMMMVTFMPLAGAGFFGAKVDISTLIGLLVLNLIFGAVLGVTYDLLGVVAPVRPAASPAGETVPVTEAERLRLSSPDYSFNDDLPSSSPSGRTVAIIFGGIVGFMALVVLVMEFRPMLGF